MSLGGSHAIPQTRLDLYSDPFASLKSDSKTQRPKVMTKCQNVAQWVPKGHQNGAKIEPRDDGFSILAIFENDAAANVKHRFFIKYAAQGPPKIDEKTGFEKTSEKTTSKTHFLSKNVQK